MARVSTRQKKKNSIFLTGLPKSQTAYFEPNDVNFLFPWENSSLAVPKVNLDDINMRIHIIVKCVSRKWSMIMNY